MEVYISDFADSLAYVMKAQEYFKEKLLSELAIPFQPEPLAPDEVFYDAIGFLISANYQA